MKPCAYNDVSYLRAYSLILTFKQALAVFDPNWANVYDASTNSTWPPAVRSRMIQPATFDGVATMVQVFF